VGIAAGYIALAVLLPVAGIGLCYEAVGEYRDRHRFPLKGALVAVDGHQMHLFCTGDGNPIVILEAPFTGISASWAPVQEAVSRFARVCSYDRAGYGWSEPGPLPRTSGQIALELHALLARADVRPPYVLVGASSGGFHVRVYNGHFPAEVAAMVLVDSSHPDQASRLNLPADPLAEDRIWGPFLPVTHRLGILRFALHREPRAPAFPADAWDEVLYLRDKTNSYRTLLRESAAWVESADQVRASGTLGAKPLLVLTGTLAANPAMRALWVDGLQADLVHLSSQGRQVLVEKSGHPIQFEAPDAVVEAIHEVWNVVRPE